MHCLRACVQWAVELLQRTASLGAVGSATRAMHCHTAWGRWAVEVVQRAGPLPEGTGVPSGSVQWKPRNALPHCLGAVGRGIPAMLCHTASGSG